MAQGKKSFILYSDLLQSIEHLTNEEKGVLFNHLLEYVNDLNPVLTDRLLLTAWKPIELQLKRDLVKFEEVKEKRSEAGKASALARAKQREQEATNSTSVKSVQQTSTNSTDNDNDTVNVNDNVNVTEIKDKTPKAFNFKEELINLGVEKQTVDDWVKARKKGTNSETAFKLIKSEIEKSKLSAQKCIETAVLRGWQGFKADWIKSTNQQIVSSPVKVASHVHVDQNKDYSEGWFKK